MGNDIVAYRITIGLFYCKMSAVCVRKTFLLSWNLFNILFIALAKMCKFKSKVLKIFRLHINTITFHILLMSLLLISGNIESHPGPGGTPDVFK